jgi:hypothetical protein
MVYHLHEGTHTKMLHQEKPPWLTPTVWTKARIAVLMALGRLGHCLMIWAKSGSTGPESFRAAPDFAPLFSVHRCFSEGNTGNSIPCREPLRKKAKIRGQRVNTTARVFDRRFFSLLFTIF